MKLRRRGAAYHRRRVFGDSARSSSQLFLAYTLLLLTLTALTGLHDDSIIDFIFSTMSPQPPKLEEIDTKSIISMQELDPSPVEETIEGFPSTESIPQNGGYPQLGLSGHHWDTWCMSKELPPNERHLTIQQ